MEYVEDLRSLKYAGFEKLFTLCYVLIRVFKLIMKLLSQNDNFI
jgi:hypothetical protein